MAGRKRPASAKWARNHASAVANARTATEYSDVPAEYKFESWWREQQSADWVVVAEAVKTGEEDYFGTSLLVPNTPVDISNLFRKVDFDGRIGDGVPEFGRRNGEAAYLPHGNFPGDPEAFVIWREFDGLYPRELVVLQEFVFYHHLYYDSGSKNYIEPISMNPVVVYEPDGLKIRVSRDHLQDFLAARSQVLVRAFDNRLRKKVNTVPDIEALVRKSDAFFRLVVRHYDDHTHDTNLFCWLLGKYLVYPFPEPKHESYRQLVRRYDEGLPEISFIVGKDSAGKQETARDHRDAPYLTPVFFKKALLEKYHNNPRLYRVEERMIFHLSKWSIPYGLNATGLVHVWLGDLWRDLPVEEQQYWRSFNVVPSGGLEPAFWATQMECEFVESDRIDQKVLRARAELGTKFNTHFKFPIFREIPKGEQSMLKNLHVPHSPELREFNEQSGYLAKLFVDALNKDALEAAVTSKADLVDENGNKKASIQVLEVFFRDAGITEGQQFCDQLRAVQSIRSAMPAHLTSEAHKAKLFTKLGFDPKRTLSEAFAKLLQGLNGAIRALNIALEK